MKKLTRWTAVTLLAGSVLAFAARAAESPSVLLQKGIYAEETEGNVDAAIKIYEQIAAEAATSRTVLAQAQYRLAVCYQKKGNKEQAIKLLNEVVQQSPSDAAMIRKARALLGELGVAPSEVVSIRKVPLAVDSERFLSISPDGRFVAYVPRDSHDLAVGEIATGKISIIAKGGKDKEPQSKPIFSPDSQWIAYDLSVAEIYAAKVDGSENRKLFEHAAKRDQVFAEAWSADSAQVGVFSWIAATEDCQGFLVDVKSGTRKEIELPQTQGDTGFEYWNLSSDRNYLAVKYRNYPSKIAIWDWKLHRMETVTDAGADRIFGWTPDDAKLLFSKNRASGVDLLAIKVKDGKPQGEPEPVWNNLGSVLPVGITRDGSIYYTVPQGQPAASELWVMEGFLARKAPISGGQTFVFAEIPPDEIIFGANGSVLDRKYGLSFALPADWTVSRAGRFGVEQNFVGFSVPDFHDVWLQLYYISNPDPKTTAENDPRASFRQLNAEGPRPKTTLEIDAWLRKFAERKADDRLNKEHLANYKIRPASFVPRTIDGRQALGWLADYTKDEKRCIEYYSIIYSENVVAQPFLQGPAEKVESIRAAYDRLIETIRLP